MSDYPRIDELGIPVEDGSCSVEDVNRHVEEKYGISGADRFWWLVGAQTGPMNKCEDEIWAWDVEAVLDRMATGRLTGTQLLWD